MSKDLTDFETLMFNFVKKTIWSDLRNLRECPPNELRGIIFDIHNGLTFLTNHKEIIFDEGNLEEYISSYKEYNSRVEVEIEQLKSLKNSSKLIDFNEIKDDCSKVETLQLDMELTDFFINLLEECLEHYRYSKQNLEVSV